MNPADGTPLAILSFFVAPAVLTNASSVLTLTTSNRFARPIYGSSLLFLESRLTLSIVGTESSFVLGRFKASQRG
jgi:hypothetical protein